MIATISPAMQRSVLGIFLVLFWIGVIAWLRLGRSPGMIALVLLVAFLAYPLYAFIKPAGQADPAMRAAQGGLAGIIFFLLVLIALVVLGMTLHRRGLVWFGFAGSMIPVIVMSCSLIVYLVNLCFKK